ncbi:MAG: hypothetical protein L6R40_004033 [Gallowayella cf. fulva]|nr:MAG: hypothetical protein L6R40_004033 [Xanthomendoza cf. fulva]
MEVSTDRCIESTDTVAAGFVVVEASSETAPNGKSAGRKAVQSDIWEPANDIPHVSIASSKEGGESDSNRAEVNGAQDVAQEPEQKTESTLPDGWEERKDPSGKPYYVDHNTRSTTWLHPTLCEGSCKEKSQKFDAMDDGTLLPAGWEQDIDPRSKRPYYIDHKTKTTSWVRPVAGIEETTMPLPKGWERRRTSDSKGRIYFVNHNEKTTSWTFPERPAEEEALERGPCKNESDSAGNEA